MDTDWKHPEVHAPAKLALMSNALNVDGAADTSAAGEDHRYDALVGWDEQLGSLRAVKFHSGLQQGSIHHSGLRGLKRHGSRRAEAEWLRTRRRSGPLLPARQRTAEHAWYALEETTTTERASCGAL